MTAITFTPLTSTASFADGHHRLRLRAYGFAEAGVHGRSRLRLRTVGGAEALSVPAEPQQPVAGIHALSVHCSGAAQTRRVANGAVNMHLSHHGFAGAPGSTSGRTWLKLRAFGTAGAGGAAYALLMPQPPEVSAFGDQWFGVVGEQFQFGADARRVYAALARSRLFLDTAPRSTFAGTVQAEDTMALGDKLSWVMHVLASSGVVFDAVATADYRVLARAVSRLILAGEATNYAEALQLIADALALSDLTDWMQTSGITDAVVLGDRLDSFYAAFAAVVEQLVLSAQAIPEFTLTVMLRDGFAVGSQTTHAAELTAQLAEAIGFAMSLSFDNGEFIAWVLNTESRGLTRYTNYPFNSFAKVGRHYYGAHAGGIARIGGDRDMGEAINAKLRLGMFDFGDRHLKSFSDVFFGMSASGQMLLKAIFVDDRTGEKSMAIYKVQARPAEAARETRAKLGKGVRAVDWDFELENVDGADFDLQSVQFFPTQMSRRTRG